VRSLQRVGSDYSLHGYTEWIGVERKTLADFIGRTSTSGAFRKFVKNQISKLQKLKHSLHSLIVVTGSPMDLQLYSEMAPRDVIEVATKITSMGVPVLFTGSHTMGEVACLSFLMESKQRMDEA
jgi:hypothetical protein